MTPTDGDESWTNMIEADEKPRAGVTESDEALQTRLTASNKRRLHPGLPGGAEAARRAHRRPQYFDLHAILDVKHPEACNAEAIRPLVAANPGIAHAIAEGALMRLRCGERCFRRSRAELGWQADATGEHLIPPG